MLRLWWVVGLLSRRRERTDLSIDRTADRRGEDTSETLILDVPDGQVPLLKFFRESKNDIGSVKGNKDGRFFLEAGEEKIALEGFTNAGSPIYSLAQLGLYAATAEQSVNHPPLVRLDCEPGGWLLRSRHDPRSPEDRLQIDILKGDPWSEATLEARPDFSISVQNRALAISIARALFAGSIYCPMEKAGPDAPWRQSFPHTALRALIAALGRGYATDDLAIDPSPPPETRHFEIECEFLAHHGWALFRLHTDAGPIEIDGVSYIGQTFNEFASSALAAATGSALPFIVMEHEPGQTVISMNAQHPWGPFDNPEQSLSVSIAHTLDGHIAAFSVKPDLFARAVCAMLTRLRDETGLDRFYERYGQLESFPIRTLAALESAIGTPYSNPWLFDPWGETNQTEAAKPSKDESKSQ